MKVTPKIWHNWNPGTTLVSRMRSNKEITARPVESAPPGQWEKPITWTTITSGGDADIFKMMKKSNSTDSRTPIVPRSQYSHIQANGRKLDSAASHYSETMVAAPRPSVDHSGGITVPESRYADKSTKKYLQRQSRNSRGGYDGGEITALPSIGCLPERTWSNEDFKIRKK